MIKIEADSYDQMMSVFGNMDENIRKIEEILSVSILNRDGYIVIEGKDEEKASLIVDYMKKMERINKSVSVQNTEYIISMVMDGKETDLDELDDNTICITSRGKPIKAKTVGQRRYVDLIKKETIVIGTGPAGTGKTFLAVSMAVNALKSKEVDRIVLTRPAIEAGENLGYLPGDLQSKIEPYLRPLYDALYEMLGFDNTAKLIERGIIEIAPLAYMRGRTLDNSFVILDEAQNTTPEQMKMFLTRFGANSKVVVTGDLTQTDLPHGKKSGLVDAIQVLQGIDGIRFHTFTDKDVVRHRLVQKIILAYEARDKKLKSNHNDREKH